jgi:hypothetical protein
MYQIVYPAFNLICPLYWHLYLAEIIENIIWTHYHEEKQNGSFKFVAEIKIVIYL